MDASTKEWNFESLQEQFCFTKALAIVTLESIRPSPSPAPDTLLFTYAKNGNFSVRKAYQMLKGATGTEPDKKLWDRVWTGNNLSPKLKVFIWRCIKGALPVRAILSYRLRHFSSDCPLCQSQSETVMHTLFHYEFAKRFWLIDRKSVV